MGVLAIAQAHHQPGPSWAPVLLGPIHATAHSSDHRPIGCNIEAIRSSQGRQCGQILEGRQIVIAGTTNPLDPTASGESAPRPRALIRPQAQL